MLRCCALILPMRKKSQCLHQLRHRNLYLSRFQLPHPLRLPRLPPQTHNLLPRSRMDPT